MYIIMATVFYELLEEALKSYVFDKVTASSREKVTEKYKMNYNPLQVSTISDVFQKIEIPHEAYLCGEMCNEAFKSVENRQGVFDTYYLYSRKHSTERVAVYTKTFLTNTAIVAIRGTKLTDVNDIQADMGLLTGTGTLSFFEMVEEVKLRVMGLMNSGFDADNIILTGFSLGGDIALDLGFKTFKTSRVITFNAGSSPLQNEDMFRNQLATNYVVEGDVISQNIASVSPWNTVVLKIPAESTLKAHKLSTLIGGVYSSVELNRERGRFK